MNPFKPPLTYEIRLTIKAHHHTQFQPHVIHARTVTGTIDRGRVRQQLRDAFAGILAWLKHERERVRAEPMPRKKRY